MKKVEFEEYSDEFPKKFAEMESKIRRVLWGVDIHHVGSTAIPGLGGKGIIDVLIGIDSWKNINKIVDKLKIIGFIHVHPKEKGRIFLANRDKNSRFGDFHIHIVRKNNKQYQDFISFRDMLRKNRRLRNNYQKMKSSLVIKTHSDREKYHQAKSEYIKNILRSVSK